MAHTGFHKTISIALFLLLPLTVWGQSSGGQPASANIALQKADSLRHLARYDSSSHYYQKAARALTKAKDRHQLRTVAFKLSLNKLDQGKTREAAEYLEQSYSLSMTHFPRDTAFLLQYYHHKGLIAEADGEYHTALETYHKALTLIGDSGRFPSWEARIRAGLGELYSARGEYPEAIKAFARAEELYHRNQLNHQQTLSRIYNNRGIAHKQNGQYAEALKFYRKSLSLDRKRYPRIHPELAKSHNNLAIIYYYQSDYQRALDHMKNAVDIFSEYHGRNHRFVAAGYNNMGVIYSEMGALEPARNYLTKSLEIKKRVLGEEHPQIAIALLNLGAIDSDLKQYNRAIDRYKQAETLFLKLFSRGHPELANVYANLGEAYSGKGKYQKALSYYLKDLSLNRQLLGNRHPYIGDTYTKVGKVHVNIQNYEQALNYYQQAISIFRSDYSREKRAQYISLENSAYPSRLLKALQFKAEALAEYSRETNDNQLLVKSLQTYLQATRVIEHLQQSYSRERSKFLLRERTVDIYNRGFETAFDLYTKTGKEDYKEYAFYFSAKSQNQILLAKLRDQDARSFANIPDSLVRRGRKIRQRISTIQQQLSENGSGSQALDSTHRLALQNSLFRSHRELEDHIRYLESSYPEYYELKYNTTPPRVSEIQNTILSPGQTLIQYFLESPSLYAIVISPNTFDIRKISSDSLIGQRIKNFRRTILEITSADSFSTKSHKLYTILIDPITDLLINRQLTIIPDGPLHYLPFESLVQFKNRTAKTTFPRLAYLMNDYTINYAPSAGLLKLKSPLDAATAPKVFLGMAPAFNNINPSKRASLYARFGRFLSPLPISRYEVEKISDILQRDRGFWSFLPGPTVETDVYTGADATEERFKQLPLQRYQYLHLATHAFISEDQPGEGGILFAHSQTGNEDGILTISEIYTLELNSQLVTLSACNTGMGTIAEGEGIMSVSRAFQYAGAQNLLVSLWSVDDRSASQLMIRFYKQLQQAGSMPRALQYAKKEIIRQGQFAHPKYWAPFIFIGQ